MWMSAMSYTPLLMQPAAILETSTIFMGIGSLLLPPTTAVRVMLIRPFEDLVEKRLTGKLENGCQEKQGAMFRRLLQ